MKRIVLSILLAGLLPVAGALGQTSSVVIDQVPPYTMGQVFTFTSIFPSEARQGGRVPQFEFHPRIQINCTQDGVGISQSRSVDPEGAGHRRNSDGTWTGYSDPIMLVLPWIDPTRPASCLAILWNPTQTRDTTVYTIYATLAFDAFPN